MTGATHLRALRSFRNGDYTGDEANSLIQLLYKLYSDELDKQIPKIASRITAEFFLSQYDEAVKNLHGESITDLKDRGDWRAYEGLFKRTIKYLVERICMSAPSEFPTTQGASFERAVESAWICAEQMIGLSEMSSQLHAIFPDHISITLFKEAENNVGYRINRVGKAQDVIVHLEERDRLDRNNRENYVSQPQFEVDFEFRDRFLNRTFSKELGVSLQDAEALLANTIVDSQPASGSPTLFINQTELVEDFASAAGLSFDVAKRVFDGFTVRPDQLIAEGRVPWKPKQENRAYRRGFFLFPHRSGPHLMFSRSMANEAFRLLAVGLSYQKAPKEWMTAGIQTELKNFSNAAGCWFEGEVKKNLNSIGYIGSSVNRRLTTKLGSISIPSNVGQFDFLGASKDESAIIVLEAKMTYTGGETRTWRDDLHRFKYSKTSFQSKLKTKLKWVESERKTIASILDLPRDPKIFCAFVTLYPCIAHHFIDEFACISITEFMLDYQREQRWSYSIF